MKFSFPAQLLLIFASVISGFALLLIATSISFSLGFHITSIDSSRIIQILQSLLVFIIPSLFCAYLIDSPGWALLRINSKSKPINYFWVALFAITVIPFINLINDLNMRMQLPESLATIEQWMRTFEARAIALTEEMLSVTTWQALSLNLLVMAIAPAIGEEFLFRGLIQRTLEKQWGTHIGVWVAAIIFSAIHMQFYGFVPRMLLGAAFGYMAVWTGSLWLPVLAHFINNALSVIIFYLAYNGFIPETINTLGVNDSWWIAIASFAIALWALVHLYKRSIESTNSKTPITT